MSSSDGEMHYDALLREVLALRAQVADLQRAAARHEDTEGISLAEREELLREAERIAHLGTWTWDIQSGRVTWSEEMYRILGFTPGSVTPSVEGFFAAVHPEDRARSEATAQQAIEDGVLPLVDCRIVRPDGSIRHTTSSGSYLFDAEGKARRMVGGVLDRTQSLETEAKLRRALALLEEAQRLAQLGSWRFDPESGELEWSTEFRRIAGLPSEGPPSIELFMARVAPEDQPRFRASYEQTLSQPEGGQMDGRLVRPNGEVRHVRIRGALVPKPGGGQELRGTMQDVTDQVRLREELAHAQKMEAVGRLAAGIAHDFNNLLTVVKGNLELMSDRIADAPELEESLRALDSAANLTRRLLAFGRKAQLSLKLVNPNELVSSTMTLMHRLVGDEVKLETGLAPGLPLVLVDSLEIERALVNLVVNARDAMPRGGVVGIATRERWIDGTRWVELSVADRGAGISEEDRQFIFEPFYTTRRNTGGTGLGLATVLGTAEQHGGTVEVSGREGGGAVFTMLLPAAESRSPRQSEHPHSASAQATLRSLQLMVIDDEPMVADVTRRMLASRGHVVHVANNPGQAQTIWREHGSAINLVLCDVVMPEMRGPELIEHLASSGVVPRVLFLSGYNEEGTHAKLGHPVLAKPFSAAALEAAIMDAIPR